MLTQERGDLDVLTLTTLGGLPAVLIEIATRPFGRLRSVGNP